VDRDFAEMPYNGVTLVSNLLVGQYENPVCIVAF
jgi:hypothetical protein